MTCMIDNASYPTGYGYATKAEGVEETFKHNGLVFTAPSAIGCRPSLTRAILHSIPPGHSMSGETLSIRLSKSLMQAVLLPPVSKRLPSG